jgi:trans-aconitate methyltransferase
VATAVTSERRAETNTIEQERPYTLGSVWSIAFMRVKSGHELDYARELAATTAKMLDEQKKQGVILSYKILSGMPSNREDFTHILMMEFPNYAAFDQLDKMDAVAKKVVGSLAGYSEMMRKREEIREAIGTKVLRELHLKK